LWLLVVLGAAVLEESGAKIAAALKGRSVHVAPPAVRRMNSRAGVSGARRFETRWRAAA
jgi:hypothetical protein